MKKIVSLNLALILLTLCGCSTQSAQATQFLFDTVVTLKAQCDEQTLNGAFLLCAEYEKLLSRSVESSDVALLNASEGELEVSEHTTNIIERSLYYSNLTDGKFDITVYPVSALWDFNGEVIPSKDEIAAALQSVDYQSIALNGNRVNLGGAKIDLGGIAKGYIADRVREYFTEKGVKKGIIDLGGNIVVFGDEEYNVGIKKPFSQNEIAASVKVKNMSVVTSGIYERYIESDNKIYHHILDTKTGYGVQTDLYSATIICESSFDADALSTVCMLEGLDRARQIIESTPNAEAIFIDREQKLHYTSGLTREGNSFVLQ